MKFRSLIAGVLAFVLAALPAAAQVVEFAGESAAPIARIAPPSFGLGGELAAHLDHLSPVLALPAVTARDVALAVAAQSVTPAQKAAGIRLLDALAGPPKALVAVQALIEASPADAGSEKRRVLEGALKRLGSSPDFRRDLARETASLRAFFDGSNGDAESAVAAAQVRKTIDALDAAGAPVNAHALLILRSRSGAASEAGSMISLHPNGTLIVDARRVERAAAALGPAAFRGRLESQLLAEQLKAGLPPPLRGGAAEVEATRRDSSSSRSRRIREYQDRWLSKLEGEAADAPALPAFLSRRPKEKEAFRDGRSWVIVDGNRVKTLDEEGRTVAQRRVPEAWLGAFDAKSRTLFLPAGPRKFGRSSGASFYYFMEGLGLRALNLRTGKSRTLELPGNFWIEDRLQWDPVSRRIVGLIWEGSVWSLAQWPLTPRGFGPPLRTPLGRGRLSAAFDFARRRVFLAEKGGTGIESRALKPDGSLGEPVRCLEDQNVSELSLSERTGILAAGRAQGWVFLRFGGDGEIASRSAEIPAAFGGLTPAGGDGWLYSREGDKRARLLPADFAERDSALRGLEDKASAADALAAALTHRPERAREIARAVRGDEALTAAVWESWARRWRDGNLSAQDLRRAPGSTRWFPGAEVDLKTKMPTLWGMLRRPRRLGSFLAMLSFLRLVYPYTDSARSPRTPLDFAFRSGRVFRLNELMIMPDTESFRRHLIAAAVPGGLKTVELKIPGAEIGRTFLGRATFDAARDLWKRHPGDARTALVRYFGWFRGTATLYGRKQSFDREEAGLALSDYSDGKRLSNRLTDLKRAGGDDSLRVLADAAVTSIRLHELGWSGVDPEGGTEMHSENVRWLANGRGELVSDFNAMNRRRLTAADRRAETLNLIGRRGRLGVLFLDDDEEQMLRQLQPLLPKLYPLVLDGVASGASAAERRRLARVVQEELGYEPPRTP